MEEPKIAIINIADIRNPETGKTYRQENLEKVHSIPLGALVEVRTDDDFNERKLSGLRLFVVQHSRDCDGTPLYGLSFNSNWKIDMYGEYTLLARASVDHGYSEESLAIIRLP